MEHSNSLTTTYESFIASFTGTLTTFISNAGLRYSLGKPGLKMKKGQRFVIRIDTKDKSCRIIPVVPPDPRIH